MKRILTILIAAWLIALTNCRAQGIPFLKTYSAEEYQGHDFNFDINVAKDGTVYMANFEGLLYYDNATWRMIHTTGNNRVTVTYIDHNDQVWVGGYNYFGRVSHRENGQLYLEQIGGQNLFLGEVLEIWEKDGLLQFVVNDGKLYQMKDGMVGAKKQITNRTNYGMTDVVNTDDIDQQGHITVKTDIIQVEPLENGHTAIINKGQGLSITDRSGRELYTLTEQNGLPTNNITWVNYNHRGVLWGATEDGIFSAGVSSAYSHFGENEGLKGDVLSMVKYNQRIYVGTVNGLFRLEGHTFKNVAGITHGCWQLAPTNNGLLVATTNGTYLMAPNETSRQLNTTSTTAILGYDKEFLSGEIDGVYLTQIATGARKMVCSLDRVNKIIEDSKGNVWLQSMYGEIWYKPVHENDFRKYQTKGGKETVATLVKTSRRLFYVRAENVVPFPYPLFSYPDSTGVTWLTNHEGKGLYRWKRGKRLTDLDELLRPVSKMAVRAIMLQGDEIWLGTDKGVTVINTSVNDPARQNKPKMLIREITLNNDSILWGGYGEMPEELPTLGSRDHNLYFIFSLDNEMMVGETLYRSRMNNGQWSAWTEDHHARYLNLSPGNYTFEAQALDAFGRMSEVVSISFKINYPFYLRWYMNILYMVIIGLLIYAFTQWRLRLLEREKHRLESIVEERTEEVRRTHKELVKQEKMATVGKLTQGLIDRILNPLNYINNFSKLSEGLVKDIEANIDDEKDKMDAEIYDDTKDVLGMLAGNLQKVGEHGQNTTRTLKAMEEMLKDRTGGIVKTDLTQILRQNEEMVGNYYAKDISEHHIKTAFNYPNEPIWVMVNPELMSKVFMSILSNGIYAVVKKAKLASYLPAVNVEAETDGDNIIIRFNDNGVGIEDKIIDKIFDPFFTTKTTGEASGIGLYLSHDIILNYGGNITVKSVKDEFTEFTVTLPTIKE